MVSSGADSESGLKFLKYRPPKFIFGKIWTEKVKIVCFAKNWHTWYLGRTDSKSDLDFRNSDLKIHFWANLGKKHSCLFLFFETILLFLDILLVLVVYFKTALTFSAAFYSFTG